MKTTNHLRTNPSQPACRPHTAAVYLPLVEDQRRAAAVFGSRPITAPAAAVRRPVLKPVPVDFSQLSLISA